MATNPTVSELRKAAEITDQEIEAAISAVLANPKVGPFELASGWTIDLTKAVMADRHASAIIKEPTAKAGSKRLAVRSAILLAHPAKG
ncbi:hypothetical protein [Methylobacterium sp. CM6257]